MLTETAIKRLVEPDEVAELVAWVAGPAASYVNGASMTTHADRENPRISAFTGTVMKKERSRGRSRRVW